MNQTLHIFLKDMRRFWAEIFISVAITAVFFIVGGYLLKEQKDDPGQTLALLVLLLAALVPVGWWVLIARVIHAEKLVGDTQFWITRPYRWKNLLAAKLLFLVAFLYVPLFIAQCLLLAEAGFPPLHYLPGLLFNLLLITGTGVLPLAAIATVTSTFARMTLTLLSIFLCFVAVLAGLSFVSLNQNQAYGVDSHIGDHICIIIAFLAFSAAIGLQYSMRRVSLARGVLMALPVLLFATFFYASKYDEAQMSRVYLTTQAAAPIQLKYSPDPHSSGGSNFPASPRVMIPISVPLAETGVAEGYAVLPDAVRVDITAPDGSHWNSDWQNGGGYRFLPGESRASMNFWMPIAVYRKLQSLPLAVHLVLAITDTRAGKVTSIPMSEGSFSVPEFGVCSPQTGWAPLFGQMTGINCVSAVRVPPLTYISTRWSDAPCSASPGAPDSGALGTGWVGSLDSEPAQLGISPVVDLHLNLSNAQVNEAEGKARFRHLCPGTLITFTQYAVIGRTQTSIDFEGFNLPRMTMQGNQITITQ